MIDFLTNELGLGGLVIFLFVGLVGWMVRQSTISQTQREMEKFRSANLKDLEEVRFELNRQFDRTLQLHKLEFEVLPKIWEALIKSRGYVQDVMDPTWMAPNLGEMGEAEAYAFLEKNEELHTVESLMANRHNPQVVSNHYHWKTLQSAHRAQQEFNNLRLINGVFFTEEIDDALLAVSNTLTDAVSKGERSLRETDFEITGDDLKVFNREIEEQMARIKTMFKARIWSKKHKI